MGQRLTKIHMLSELQIFGALLAALPVGALALALGKALYR